MLAASILVCALCGCTNKPECEPDDTVISASDEEKSYSEMTPEEITASLTLEQKAAQMVIPAIYNADAKKMEKSCYGSILSTYGYVEQYPDDWRKIISEYQDSALASDAGIPFIYGQDSVHGVNYSLGTVIFPQNINIGCANDEELTYQMGLAVADEMKMTGMIWNYGPCVATSKDPRWGRTYESMSSEEDIVKKLSTSFVKGQLDGGVVVCAKHYLADGNVKYGTGETSFDGQTRLIDRGDAIISEEDIAKQLEIYKSLIDAGAQSIMVSHSALNGVKMHENKQYLTDVLRGELGFEGVIVSDWESIQNITSTKDYKEQVITSINAGIDWLMEPVGFDKCVRYIVEAVGEGTISEERVNDAVTRIIKLKKDAGLFDDPYLENVEIKQGEAGSREYRDLACKLVEKSQVLLKNENGVLPLKSGSTVYVTGSAANDTGVACGGWTRTWNGMTDRENNGRFIPGATTIFEGLRSVADEYGLTITNSVVDKENADVVLLCLGEQPYAEWNGDTEDLSITGKCALSSNQASINEAKALGKPVVTLLVTGRNVIISDYEQDWDAVVMCGLFGTEGQGVANVLTGKAPFSGKLAMPWYKDVNDIESGKPWLEVGFGLAY